MARHFSTTLTTEKLRHLVDRTCEEYSEQFPLAKKMIEQTRQELLWRVDTCGDAAYLRRYENGIPHTPKYNATVSEEVVARIEEKLRILAYQVRKMYAAASARHISLN